MLALPDFHRHHPGKTVSTGAGTFVPAPPAKTSAVPPNFIFRRENCD
jgi:hypothetical protein